MVCYLNNRGRGRADDHTLPIYLKNIAWCQYKGQKTETVKRTRRARDEVVSGWLVVGNGSGKLTNLLENIGAQLAKKRGEACTNKKCYRITVSHIQID
jgi:hypothetical protein